MSNEILIGFGNTEDRDKEFNDVPLLQQLEALIANPFVASMPPVMNLVELNNETNEQDSSLSEAEPVFSEPHDASSSSTTECSTDTDCSRSSLEVGEVEYRVTGSSQFKIAPITPTKQTKYKVVGGLLTPHSGDCLSEDTDQPSAIPRGLKQKSDESTSPTKRKSKKAPAISPFFAPSASVEKAHGSSSKENKPRQIAGTVSCIPFPPLNCPSFGLLQEKLAHDPFRLLIGVTFLNRTRGKQAIPVFYALMDKYPNPAALLAAPKADIVALTHHLGLQTQRAATYQKLAHFFLHDPPTINRRYRVPHYPNPGDGLDIHIPTAIVDDSDPRIAWEIGHLTQGRYALDSWRIFCRDVLRGEAEGWNGEGRPPADGFQPEWMRVQPADKELVALLRWMWLKEGFSWDPVTGEKEVAGRELMEAAIEGRIAWDERGGMRVLDPVKGEVLEESRVDCDVCVETEEC